MSMKSDCDNCVKENEVPIADDDGVNKPTATYLNNERGEDYQEQIGMPDEQNMRSWSHHHSTDTVDDPIFRAAMRGYDTVSFVFGLEVTWSLIQHRQQEEEEQQALLELESMNEINGISNEADETIMEDDDEEVQDHKKAPSQKDDESPENFQRSNVTESAEDQTVEEFYMVENVSSSPVCGIEAQVVADDDKIDTDSQDAAGRTEDEDVPTRPATTVESVLKSSTWECEVSQFRSVNNLQPSRMFNVILCVFYFSDMYVCERKVQEKMSDVLNEESQNEEVESGKKSSS
jgi:hypothetical protein